jgi:1-acyl-sn-glycerol-3-phosphate acyltransferase
MILKARHHWFIYPFFVWFTRQIIRRHFHSVEIKGNFVDRKLPILLVSNHISWWDGFWALHLNDRVFKRKFHFMMLEEQLRKHIYFNSAGGYSVARNSRSVLESLDYSSELLTDSENLVLIFPQGKIVSAYRQRFEFQKGIERILQKNGSKQIQLIFLVNMVDFLSNKKPVLYQYFTEHIAENSSSFDLQNEYNVYYGKCLKEQSDKEE